MSVITNCPIEYSILEEALGNVERLRYAFTWEKSFQGDEFWRTVAEGTALPEQKKIALGFVRTELLLHKGVALEVTQKELEELL